MTQPTPTQAAPTQAAPTQAAPTQTTPTDSTRDLDLTPRLLALASPEGRAFLAFNGAAERTDGVLPRKYRELIALGVALTTQCMTCIEVHTRHARAHGVTAEELAEAAFVAAAVRAGGSLAHALAALRRFDAAVLEG
ncbi:carboxymuconolactone decarboxylase family protein [Bradyrhizobium sp. U87765 SZCCT0131]|uniref:carboxymuconolactone decarboxylase family protein n=1 Tax=unclassified Bradyrhizobium TaxID=2631580 RepID=UPI001BAA85C7|nr:MULTISPECIES: carboxymuconolactone decarboxylase family protein [unclassified Bradyrhizobium]MBR1222283.1 carboxymuconolactone decarboxylase family protein [Bradyrhizobium sp. U87765 SZCCT0131]MBR1264233.1 carboxymuconolactone decarboxylase family protein [Bradyrhizobium sp. U87765 SZCCT0134]MBR1307984.1 carboxymuconolactone decarboxylase family protein [Bradyrhizobium sp. U87765 SZCCT0110]MBR1320483.1 carboxymuconolactone decarboxylase family protein [Bradyrhizobium sp. U87765 SZCCT0109]MB